MVTIKNTDFTSGHKLSSILYVKTKEDMQKIAKRLDFYISPNITKDKMASRLAAAMLENPIEIVSRLSKSELLLLEEFLKAGANKYVVKKMRKTEYMLQKWCLILTHEDEANNKWSMIMPDEVRESLATEALPYIELAKEGKKGPTAKELRMASMMRSLLGHDNFSIIDGMIINHGKPVKE